MWSEYRSRSRVSNSTLSWDGGCRNIKEQMWEKRHTGNPDQRWDYRNLGTCWAFVSFGVTTKYDENIRMGDSAGTETRPAGWSMTNFLRSGQRIKCLVTFVGVVRFVFFRCLDGDAECWLVDERHWLHSNDVSQATQKEALFFNFVPVREASLREIQSLPVLWSHLQFLVRPEEQELWRLCEVLSFVGRTSFISCTKLANLGESCRSLASSPKLALFRMIPGTFAVFLIETGNG